MTIRIGDILPFNDKKLHEIHPAPRSNVMSHGFVDDLDSSQFSSGVHL